MIKNCKTVQIITDLTERDIHRYVYIIKNAVQKQIHTVSCIIQIRFISWVNSTTYDLLNA